MREDNLLCLRLRTFVFATTDSRHKHPVYPNLAAGLEVKGVNQLWVADAAYIRLETELIYLTVILDAQSRRVIDPTLEASLVVAALRRAGRQPTVSGSCCIIMGRKGNPYDNLFSKSFMNTARGRASDSVKSGAPSDALV